MDAWESPLDDLVSELSTIKNVPDIIISKATDIKKKINAVRNGVNALMSTMVSSPMQTHSAMLFTNKEN